MATASCLSIILAAGNSTRMRSNLSKILHKVANLPMICHVIHKLRALDDNEIIVVLQPKAEQAKTIITNFVNSVKFVEQKEALGTAHALKSALENITKTYDDIIVCFGDTPLIEPNDLLRARACLANGADLVVFGFIAQNPQNYGRLIIEDNKLLAIIEEKEANNIQKQINYCNGGVMAINGKIVKELLQAIDNNNSTGEYYLTDIVKIANARNYNVQTIEVALNTIKGVNTIEELSEIEAIWQNNKRKQFLNSAVFMQDANSIYFSFDTEIEPGAELETNIYFGPGCYVEKGAIIKSFCHLEGTIIKKGAQIGPFARLRPGSILDDYSKIGNFCEIKQSHIGAYSKVNHLSYIGDALVGINTNIGAGAITCNYDGIKKWRTIIENNVFVGSNCSLIAPITIREGAYVASSSNITQDVPSYSLAIGRARQINKENYVLKKGPKKKEK